TRPASQLFMDIIRLLPVPLHCLDGRAASGMQHRPFGRHAQWPALASGMSGRQGCTLLARTATSLRRVGAPLIRPFDVRDDINEPTWTCSRRVVAGAHQRNGLREPSDIDKTAIYVG